MGTLSDPEAGLPPRSAHVRLALSLGRSELLLLWPRSGFSQYSSTSSSGRIPSHAIRGRSLYQKRPLELDHNEPSTKRPASTRSISTCPVSLIGGRLSRCGSSSAGTCSV